MKLNELKLMDRLGCELRGDWWGSCWGLWIPYTYCSCETFVIRHQVFGETLRVDDALAQSANKVARIVPVQLVE